VGRHDDIEKLEIYLKSPGIHPIVVGARGIGKTSLVQQVIHKYRFNTQIEANTVSGFNELARCICDDLGIENIHNKSISYEEESLMKATAKIVVAEGGLEHKKKSVEHVVGLADKDFSPQDLKRLLMSHPKKSIISIDELDDIDKNSDISFKLAKLAKSLSNQAKFVKQKFVFSGIGRDAHSLFKEHLSSQRNHPVIYLRPLKYDDFNKFFSTAQRHLGINIPQSLRDNLIADADGFPYFIHQVCFHMFSAFEVDKRATALDVPHLIAGKQQAFDDAFSHYLRKYKFSIYKLTDVQESILREMVTTRKRVHKYKNIKRIVMLNHGITEKDAGNQFVELQRNEYIEYRKGDDTIRLKDALLKPFLCSKLRIESNSRQRDLKFG